MLSDIEIAQGCQMRPITDVAADAGLDADDLELYGKYKAKLSADVWNKLAARPNGKLVLVTAINPTPAGEGKTTTTVGLGQAMAKLGKKAMIALREPSLGPVFGIKGGAAGGGYAQVVPMEDINLHFTGDMHAITAANNLLCAMLDNHMQQGNALGIDPRRVIFTRVMDMNDRALRNITIGLGGKVNGVPREDHFMITVASEVMAILCLASDLEDLKKRFGDILVAYSYDGKPVYARDLQGRGRDGRADEGRDQAQSGADARGHALPDARRPVRQHRARLQQRAGDRPRAQAGGHRHHRGGLRRGPRRGEVHGHQVPQGRPCARLHRAGRDRARAQVQRRRCPRPS